MRLKKKPWAAEYIKSNEEFVAQNPSEIKGDWTNRFEKRQPIHIEVGSGKGKFIHELAIKNPHINYVAVEVQEAAVAMILKKVVDKQINNLQILFINASDLREYFAENEVDKIYLNFSDPWPKTRHTKRRLTHKNFLSAYKTILKHQGEFQFKTDNQGLFEYSLMSINNFGFNIEKLALDLHNNLALNEGNIQTEYEMKFSERGFPIYLLSGTFR